MHSVKTAETLLTARARGLGRAREGGWDHSGHRLRLIGRHPTKSVPISSTDAMWHAVPHLEPAGTESARDQVSLHLL